MASRDPYGQNSPYSSWRSGGWGDLLYRQSPQDRIVGRDDLGEYSRAQQIASNFAGAMGFIEDADLVNKFKGGENTYNLTAGDVDKYAQNILRQGQQIWDKDADMQLEYLNKLDGFTPGGVATDAQKEAAYQGYIKDNPLLAAADQGNLLYDENLGLHFQDKSGDMVPFAYKKGHKAYDPSSGYKGVGNQLFESLGYETYGQQIPRMIDGLDEYDYDKNNNIQYDTKNLYRRADDWSPEFQYEHLNKEGKPLDWTLKNIMDKDWRSQKVDDARNLLSLAGGIPEKLRTGLENKLITSTGDKYDDAFDTYNRIDDYINTHSDILDNIPLKDMQNLLGIEELGRDGTMSWKKGTRLQDVKEFEQSLIDKVMEERMKDPEFVKNYEAQNKGFGADFGKEFKEDLEGGIDTLKRKYAVRNVDEDKDAIPDFIDADTQPDMQGPREGTPLEKMGRNLKKAWGDVKEDFTATKEDLSNIPGQFMEDVNEALYQDDEEGVTYAPLSDQIENQINLKKQEKEDWLNSQVSEEPETADEQYERLNQVTLADDPTEWDSRRTLGDNLLKLAKGDFANPDDSSAGYTSLSGSKGPKWSPEEGRLYREDEMRDLQSQGANVSTKDEMRGLWEDKFKDLGVSFDEFKNEISEGVDDVKSDYESWKSKRAVRDVDEDSDGIPDLLDADTQPLEQGAREGTFLEKAKEGLLQKYGGGEYKEARDKAKVDKFYKENPDRDKNWDEKTKTLYKGNQQNKIMETMISNPEYKSYLQKHHPDAYRMVVATQKHLIPSDQRLNFFEVEDDIKWWPRYGNLADTETNNLMKAWENEQLDMDPEWEGGSSGTNYYDEENFNFNPGGL